MTARVISAERKDLPVYGRQKGGNWDAEEDLVEFD